MDLGVHILWENLILIVDRFINMDYLPEKYEITAGLVHTDMEISNRTDIFLYDSSNYAPLYFVYANKIIHIRSLGAVIEFTLNLKFIKEVLTQ
ncbi:DUF6602 domain-containing protein [Bacillus cereus]|uniref:DUF6602 domain-containing protein n=1 Tax=Bacillus cereus TaxID=1396 RepID=UPI00123B8C4B|nr:DUF6602 domain-containing protein [Bacillus cereus]KAA6472440.1 hypothetical protein DX931_24910 [Bacillus cereus]